MKNRKWKIATLIILLAICIPAAFSQAKPRGSKKIATLFPELAPTNRSAMRLLYSDSIGGLHEILMNGKVRKVFQFTNPFQDVCYNVALKRYILIEKEHTDKVIKFPGESDEVRICNLLIHHVDEKGTINKTIPQTTIQRYIHKMSFSPSGSFVLVTTNWTQRIIKRRSEEDCDAYYVEDIYKIDTKTGAANLLLQGSCRSLGAIHPQEEQFLFTNEHGVICQYDLNKKSSTPLIQGSRPYWNSEGTAVRYVPKVDWFTRKGVTTYPKWTGDDRYEFEYNIETKKKTKLGLAGMRSAWAPNREYGVRVFHYDTLFKDGWGIGIGLGKVVLESSDGKRKALLVKDIKFPSRIFWVQHHFANEAVKGTKERVQRGYKGTGKKTKSRSFSGQ